MRNLRKKGRVSIKLITKREAMELQALGYRFGDYDELHKSVNKKHPKYYLTENAKNLYDLKKIRDKKLIA